ncbi:exostosin-like 2 isoform X1 [Lagopus muta]|uniref:exostosin-like 2 isoform X1 n=1 Tax=Lagopus muta TaxID=64668 RepID=UPI00209DD83B|nr:exostosin-like 2 isoform X1 [Lagopus muta]XP_048801436.1 exostosin-like 2 isoform X1 [Lagopus muta]XP_048801437.1 exostosin-like 2 isoform X1 [Lagopus muta]XP_048801438.1 exostosin-like 2 isoform X1 [Lagopus muta]XP_048801440.1 exostosin-like 2 isoform X1 [Lagopus muta]
MRYFYLCKLPGRVMGIRLLRFTSVVIIILLLVAGALTALLPSIKDDKILNFKRESKTQSQPAEDSFTLIMQTYNRTDLLLKLLNHYQAIPHLHKVIVVWNNIGEKMPEKMWNSLGPHPVPVIFKAQSVNRMRNRLQNFPELETKAVLMMDDDTLVSAHDLTFAFSVWQQFPEHIVGFIPRKHISTPSGVYSYGSFELQNPTFGNGDQYSMVLIGAAFFHCKYLEDFQRQPEAVYALIDETQNCDDIAMNFLVAKNTGKPSGVFVKPVDIRNLEKDTNSGYSGMWHRAEHLLQRSYCVNKLVNIYDGMPLKYSNIMISQFGFPNYANHKSKV